jgi:hypothetical protein
MACGAILGLSETYEVVMPDWNYYLIAEVTSSGMLGVRSSSTDRQIYFLDYQGKPPWPALGDTLATAFSDMLLKTVRSRSKPSP